MKLIAEMPDSVSALPDPQGVGIFLRFTAEKPAARHVFTVGELPGIARFTACHRYEPYWMKAMAGMQAGETPVETQVLLAELTDGRCALLVPLVDGPFRAALQGADAHGLELVAETGDPDLVGESVTGLFVAVGDDPYTLVERAAPAVMAQMGTGRLRRDKALPEFVDRFGWCTWDAFYQEVSQEKVRQGLESFAAGGVPPRLLILDDGWQSVRQVPSGAMRQTGFAANEKFPGDLKPLVEMAKGEFGVESFLVWHALTGYWGGVDGEAMPGYGVRAMARNFSPGILHHMPGFNNWWGGIVGVVAPEQIYRFFQDYHRHLRAQGVDGVKVDTQATLEGVAAGFGGGRVGLMRAYHEALEGSVQTHFQGELINCMSCASEMLYGALNSTVTRTSTDFWPDRPESHGLHLYVNAQVSLWFGEFVHPDWDMFQSGHEMGAYHAAGRAVGGCPVYVSDKVGAHNFELLRKLVRPDGRILRADLPGRPTRDCLFHDPTKEDVLLKIFNRNGEAGVVGVFNARYAPEDPASARIAGSVGPEDVEGIEGERFAVYAHAEGGLHPLGRKERWELTLEPLTYEVFTIVPIVAGFAPIGLADLFNSAGAVLDSGLDARGAIEVILLSGGRFLAWCEERPQAVDVAGAALDFTYDAEASRLEVIVPGAEPVTLRIVSGSRD
jgi:raffinose synthase